MLQMPVGVEQGHEDGYIITSSPSFLSFTRKDSNECLSNIYRVSQKRRLFLKNIPDLVSDD